MGIGGSGTPVNLFTVTGFSVFKFLFRMKINFSKVLYIQCKELYLCMDNDVHFKPLNDMNISYTEYQVLKSIVAKFEKEQLNLLTLKMPDPKKSRLITDMDISLRLYNCLKFNGINTIDQLVEKSVSELLSIRNFGKLCLNETQGLVEEYGLELKK